MKTITLYRPVGLREMELIVESGWENFPPRLAWQPIFYPVLNQQYAEQIASEWNKEDEFSGFCGIVTAFDMQETYISKFEVQNVGGVIHNELWIPADELDSFNQHIIGKIRIINAFIGSKFKNSQITELALTLENYDDTK